MAEDGENGVERRIGRFWEEGSFLQQSGILFYHQFLHEAMLIFVSVHQDDSEVEVVLSDEGMVEGLEVFFYFVGVSDDEEGQLLGFVEETLVPGVEVVLFEFVRVEGGVSSELLAEDGHFHDFL